MGLLEGMGHILQEDCKKIGAQNVIIENMPVRALITTKMAEKVLCELKKPNLDCCFTRLLIIFIPLSVLLSHVLKK